MGSPTDGGQDAASARSNSAFFHENTKYAQLVGTLETYRNIRMAVNAEVAGSQHLLDVGNGGVFDYDPALAQEIVAVDLFLDGAPQGSPDHVTWRRGDALALDEPTGGYDCVVEISVLHHLVGSDVDSTFQNIRRAAAEAHRVLSSGGRLVVMESCVGPRAFGMERRAFQALRRLAGTRLLPHPPVLQFSVTTITSVLREQFDDVRVSAIPVGRWILQFGIRWPTALTPARPYLFVATKG